MGSGASSSAKPSDQPAKLAIPVEGLSPGQQVRLLVTVEGQEVAGEPKPFTLYIRKKCVSSMRVLVFLCEAGMLNKCEVVGVEDMPKEVMHEITSQFESRIAELASEGETWLPALKDASGYTLDDDQIMDKLAKAHGVDASTLKCLHIFNTGVAKDFKVMQKELLRLSGNAAVDKDGDGTVENAEAWFAALETDGDGHVDLQELIHGLDATRLMTEARRGSAVNVSGSRWTYALKQVDMLVRSCPEFAGGWRLRMQIGTICDDYDMILESADQVVKLKPGDAQALTLKALYCRSLKRDGFAESMEALAGSAPSVHEKVKRLVDGVDKYWEGELSFAVPPGLEGMAIIALGSPADDDGTPRPRLMGTLKKTLEATQMYPDVDVFVTGAAVSSNCPEAIAMKRWLQKNGVKNNIVMEMKAMDTVGNYEYIAPMLKARGVGKVILITAYYHLNRSSGLADAVFESHELPVEVVGVAGESDLKGEVLEKRMHVERCASYRDVARARHLYEAADFEALMA